MLRIFWGSNEVALQFFLLTSLYSVRHRTLRYHTFASMLRSFASFQDDHTASTSYLDSDFHSFYSTTAKSLSGCLRQLPALRLSNHLALYIFLAICCRLASIYIYISAAMYIARGRRVRYTPSYHLTSCMASRVPSCMVTCMIYDACPSVCTYTALHALTCMHARRAHAPLSVHSFYCVA